VTELGGRPWSFVFTSCSLRILHHSPPLHVRDHNPDPSRNLTANFAPVPHRLTSMSATPLHDIWEASSSQPFLPSIPKGLQFPIAFTLLFIAVLLTGLFGLSMPNPDPK